MRWADEDLQAQPGLCFDDVFLSRADGKLRQLLKDLTQLLRCGSGRLSAAPSADAAQVCVHGILSSFAGGDGLQVLLDQAALVVAGARQPDVLHVLVGEGHDGKSLICVDHLQAVGTAYGNAPSSLLQREREFQVQGLTVPLYVSMSARESKASWRRPENFLFPEGAWSYGQIMPRRPDMEVGPALQKSGA